MQLNQDDKYDDNQLENASASHRNSAQHSHRGHDGTVVNEKAIEAEATLDALAHSHDAKWEKRTIRKIDIRLLIILGLCYAVSLM